PLSERLNSTRCSHVDCHRSISKGTSFIRLAAASTVVRINLLGMILPRRVDASMEVPRYRSAAVGGAVRREPRPELSCLVRTCRYKNIPFSLYSTHALRRPGREGA